MAIDALDIALERFGPPIYVFHEIVHNKHIVDRYRQRGAVFVDRLEDVPEGSRLMVSAHGSAPEVHEAARRRRLRVFDATCPLVRKVHLEAAKFAQEDYRIVLIGHAGHDEVVGILGEAPDRIQLVETLEDVDRLEFKEHERIAYLTQTTLSVDEANVIIERLKGRYPRCVGSPKEDICYATQNRQEALKSVVTEADVVLVVGSQNSSNSNRLAELAQHRGAAAHLVDGPDEIKLSWFAGDETVVVTAGASAPEDLVEGCVALLKRHFAATVEERSSREEHVVFPLPLELRSPATPALGVVG
jgi:4-hydroxy-3-methylbut-2-enyl diphosphate reductase